MLHAYVSWLNINFTTYHNVDDPFVSYVRVVMLNERITPFREDVIELVLHMKDAEPYSID